MQEVRWGTACPTLQVSRQTRFDRLGHHNWLWLWPWPVRASTKKPANTRGDSQALRTELTQAYAEPGFTYACFTALHSCKYPPALLAMTHVIENSRLSG